ncbi:TPA: hypothetical protein DIU27_05245 [Candidatus Collierbacteria bacterium]|uniref:Uncharacterized protein n=1 Tax=Candidatus Collierbacteria bacterium GW2011_GWB2_44_22 TaxID=1618387 RepID=A0A0G1KTK7_9BACT|nr:MAG: hypothetical protein UW31_C0002G0020 [Candidatus Collierbacteria bacterium GW2011_GWA2_44_13]KKT51229.1 MAG: hypothetical protein UW44_C0014G0021 [Candidatus Collierbacteria bacterium GW2011_GWB2_44_22]KKT62188.1 MAG: hypothetical protein UW56_C0010G0020 [Candidatus Collierbacteria bacterium GW2011_GWD1_44_27]KKT65660.1 MAG: hypothetical protein UW58_C0023G0003 [Candidatus Collierbacteria bacterium GW2011_GWC2_44_30]KKT68806.1 MAG: hypothetical protein UW64_C0009G0018 [Microgenomates gr
MPNSKLRRGAKISSAEFAYGYRSRADFFTVDTPVIAIDGEPGTHIIEESFSEEERVAHALRYSKKLPKKSKSDKGAFDASRGSAIFVIESIETEFENNDVQHIFARRLTKSVRYDSNGELIEFYYPNIHYSNSVENLTVHGYMTPTFK